jgi:DNA-binding transcriptional LysR family regulator
MVELPVRGLETFLAVVEHGSLRAAAAAMGVQPPAVSHQLKVFEAQIGVAVFTRTTRSVRLTDAGRALLRRAQPAVSELAEALEEARGVGRATMGTVRLTLPYIAYQLGLASRLAAFQAAYPDVELELSFNEAVVDIVRDGFHAGIRLGDLIHEDMVALRLTPPLDEVIFASPAYLDDHGRPRKPRDLLRHNCIRYRYIGSGRIAPWEFDGADGIGSVDVTGNLIVNSTSSLIFAAKRGLGLGWLFRGNVADELASGALESVLDEHVVTRPGFFLYYPKENTRIQVVRLFVDFLRTGVGA